MLKSRVQHQRIGSEIPAERVMPGNVNASPQHKMRGDVLFLFSEGVSITNRIGFFVVLWVVFFVLIDLGMSSVIYVTDQFFSFLFLAVSVLLCLPPAPLPERSLWYCRHS